MIEHAEAAKPAVLSVVVVVFAGGRSITRTLESLARQDAVGGPVEIIVATSPSLADEQTLRSHAPAVRLAGGTAGAHPAQLRALGVRLATAPIIACTEDHCVPARDWCARIMEAHAGPALVIGGAIDKLQPDRAIGWTTYLLEYGRFMPPLAPGPAAFASDCNVSYKRSALDAIAPVWRDAFHETSVHDAIRAQAGDAAIVLDPTILVSQRRRPRLGPFLAECYAQGQLYAQLRMARYGRWRRWAHAAGSLGLAPTLVTRALKHAWRRKDARASTIRALPLLSLATLAWSAGEGVGALTAAHAAATRPDTAPTST